MAEANHTHVAIGLPQNFLHSSMVRSCVFMSCKLAKYNTVLFTMQCLDLFAVFITGNLYAITVCQRVAAICGLVPEISKSGKVGHSVVNRTHRLEYLRK